MPIKAGSVSRAPPPPPDGPGPARQTSPVRQGELDVFYDIAKLIESADDPEARVVRVLARLGALVPYERCAVLEAIPQRETHVISADQTPAAVHTELAAAMLALLKTFAEGQLATSTSAGVRLAVPLIALDQVVGVLLVERASVAYEEQHFHALSAVATELAAYFFMLNSLTGEQPRIVEPSEARQAVPTADDAKGDDAARPTQTLAGIRVLLVDDDQDIGEILQLVLEGQGAIVSVVHSAVEALAALTLSMPNVLLSDLSMPGVSGYDLMRSIVAREGKNAPPAAAISAGAPGPSRRRALDCGFQILLEKPIDHPALIAAVAKLAREARPNGDRIPCSRIHPARTRH
jgi:CheY-like chemotaxis protein